MDLKIKSKPKRKMIGGIESKLPRFPCHNYMKLFFEILYIAFSIALAKNNAIRISKDKKIYHFWQGLCHIISGIFLSLSYDWIMLPTILLTARLFFSTSLNLFRGFSPFYVTSSPTAFIDRWEQAIFGRHGEQPFFMYLFLWVICNVIIIAA